MGRPKIGLALGSGSARGWCHIGILEALIEKSVVPDIVCGSSIGALVGAAHVSGRMEPLKDWLLALNWREIVGLVSVGLSNGGLLDGDVFKNLMVKLEIDAPITQYTIPFATVATDLVTGQEIWLRDGPIHEAVRASMAMPGVFSPARQDERWLLDGGLVNPVPVSLCRALGADFVIAVNLNNSLVGGPVATSVHDLDKVDVEIPQQTVLEDGADNTALSILRRISRLTPQFPASRRVTPGYFQVFESAINIMQVQITNNRLSREPPDVLLTPRLSQVGLFDFQRAREAIAEGRASVEMAMPMLISSLAACWAGSSGPAARETIARE